MVITSVIVQGIFDSRGEPTIEINLSTADSRSFSAKIPSGKSRGKNEVAVFSYEEAEQVFRGGFVKEIEGFESETVRDLDTFLLRCDGTKRKEKLGGNVMLGISLAFARALAHERRKELWEILRDEFFPNAVVNKKPLIFANLINGGVHADNNLDIQEYMVAVATKSAYTESIQKLISFYERLGFVMKEERGVKRLPIGDEGGYSVNFRDNFAPIEMMEKLILESQLQSEFEIAIDAAASSFYKDSQYYFEGKSLSTKELVHQYKEYLEKSELLCSIEDPCGENDFEGFKRMVAIAGKRWIVGDDLTATDPEAIIRYADEKCITGVIIKANQIGTLTETCAAIRAAQERGLKCIISHRSGETDDPFLVHIAKACGADAVKIGAPIKERISKYNELIRLYS